MGCVSSKLKLKKETETMNSQSEFQYLEGRRYHNTEGAIYPMPNDEDEQDRLHLQHFLMRYHWQSNFSAPINHILTKQGAKILDIGYPTVDIIGIDISPHQPSQIKPGNFTFIKANILEGLPFEDNTFDYVFQRFMSYAYTKDEWPRAIDEIFRVLKPGGFVEFMEPSPFLFDIGPVNQRLWEAQTSIMDQRGADSYTYEKLEKLLENNGEFENIKKEVKTIRHGENVDPKLNKVDINNLINILVGLKVFMTKLLQVSDDEYDEMLKTAEKELFDSEFYYYLVRAYASKKVVPNGDQKTTQE
ncbi:23509_t:CDS:2 [Cetraspora pellucida]|uniref:23509_t:CDS:1 n=1 Tax=Cetraspora pellucida TaxID=1433469 RepID=A0A9N9A857_9GLOM|nr:23509_t:CDS:2 [Cetraspora pellucida]